MSLANVLRGETGHGSLLRIISETFVRDEPKPPLDPVASYLRASGIPSLCAREEVLCTLNKIVRRDTVDVGLNLTFLHGTALHWAVQNELLGPSGVLYGTWECLGCLKRYGEYIDGARPEDWSRPMPKVCLKCESHAFRFIEHKFVDHALRLTGHSDGFLVLPGLQGMGILEVKSIGERGGREIKQVPQIAHMVQTHIYMMFTGFKWGKILYWQKAESGLGSLVEHHIDRDEDTIDLVRNLIRSVWSGMESKTLPDRICGNDSCARAKACPVSKTCFGGP
jgi:hypothetical protein